MFFFARPITKVAALLELVEKCCDLLGGFYGPVPFLDQPKTSSAQPKTPKAGLQKLSFCVWQMLWFFGATLATFLHQPHLNPIYPSLRSPSCRSRIPHGLAFKGNFSNGGHLSQETRDEYLSVLSPRANGAPGRTWKWKQQDCLTCPRNPCKNKKPAIFLLTYWGLKSNLQVKNWLVEK